MQRQQETATRTTAVRRQDAPGKDVTFNALKKSVHSVVQTIEGQFHCLNAGRCDDLR